MAKDQGYKVLVDELTVHKAVRELTHPVTGEPTGWQQGAGETWFLDEVIPATSINPEWAEALDSGEGPLYEALKDKLEATSDEPALNEAYRMGLPFEGYDDMDEEDILAAMRVLPSPAVMRIKDWEGQQSEPRETITQFNIGYGEGPSDRQSGRLGQAEDEETDDNKAVRAIRTRQAEEGEPVIPGEGITGTGDPQIPYGATAKAESDEGDGGSGGGSKRSSTRAGRRPRPTAKKSPPSSEGGSSSSSGSSST